MEKKMKTLYCDSCGEAFQFSPSTRDESYRCKKCKELQAIKTCERCGHSIVISAKKEYAPTIVFYCDKCECWIEELSDYGFGPTMPAQVFKGNKLLAYIKDENTFLDADNNEIKIKLPEEVLKGSPYTRVFRIYPYIAKYMMDKEKGNWHF